MKSPEHPIINDEQFVENSSTLSDPSGILRRVNDGGKDFHDSDWEDFSSDGSIRDKTYELSPNAETSDEDGFTPNISDSDTHTDTPNNLSVLRLIKVTILVINIPKVTHRKIGNLRSYILIFVMNNAHFTPKLIIILLKNLLTFLSDL